MYLAERPGHVRLSQGAIRAHTHDDYSRQEQALYFCGWAVDICSCKRVHVCAHRQIPARLGTAGRGSTYIAGVCT